MYGQQGGGYGQQAGYGGQAGGGYEPHSQSSSQHSGPPPQQQSSPSARLELGKSGSFWSSLQQFDLFTKVEADYQVHTSSGATISLVGWVLIVLLVFAELANYSSPQTKEHMIVDTTLGSQMRINLNITFHALTCAEAHVDAMDVAGDNQLNIEHDMFKQRISPQGVPIGKPSVEIVGNNVKVDLPADYCGPCFGAETETRRCCNTCADLRAAYDERGWNGATIMRTAEQCLREKSNPYGAVLPGEGCRISGTMRVNKVAGNWHIAHGESIVRDGRHIHQFLPAEAPSFNVSHTIHSVSFGDPYPSMPKNPLDGVSRFVSADTGTGLFQYFIRVIPTIYSDGWRKLSTNTYTITERFKPLQLPELGNTGAGPGAGPGAGAGAQLDPNSRHPPPPAAAVLPGIFFVYDLSPFMIEVQRSRPPLSHLLTKLCAIVGGVVSVMGVIDGSVFRLGKAFAGKRGALGR